MAAGGIGATTIGFGATFFTVFLRATGGRLAEAALRTGFFAGFFGALFFATLDFAATDFLPPFFAPTVFTEGFFVIFDFDLVVRMSVS